MHAPENADAIEGCLMAACQGLDMGIAELWRRENRSGLHFSCLHVTASESTLTNFSSALLGKQAQSRKHQLSPLVSLGWGGMRCDVGGRAVVDHTNGLMMVCLHFFEFIIIIIVVTAVREGDAAKSALVVHGHGP